MGSGEEVIEDLDSALDQLIANAKTLREIEANPLFQTEAAALEKTQESLLARIIYRQKILNEVKKGELSQRASLRELGITEKLRRFKRINREILEHFAHRLLPKREKGRTLHLSRRRRKQAQNSAS